MSLFSSEEFIASDIPLTTTTAAAAAAATPSLTPSSPSQSLDTPCNNEPIRRAPKAPLHASFFNPHRMDNILRAFYRNRDGFSQSPSCIEVRASHHIPMQLHQPCQLGVFATDDITKGASLGPYAGTMTDEPSKRKEAEPLLQSHGLHIRNTSLLLDGAIASIFRRYIPTTVAHTDAILKLTADEFKPLKLEYSPFVIELFKQMPIGCMINSVVRTEGPRAKSNVKMTTVSASHELHYAQLLYVEATRNINKGEELLWTYKNPEEKLRFKPNESPVERSTIAPSSASTASSSNSTTKLSRTVNSRKRVATFSLELPCKSPYKSLVDLMAARRPGPCIPNHLMPHRLAEIKEALETTRSHNFPPRNNEQQRYGPSELTYNAQQIGVTIDFLSSSAASSSVSQSTAVSKCIAAKDFTINEVIGWVWGILVTEDQWTDMSGKNAYDSHAKPHEENFLKPIRDNIWRCLPVNTLLQANSTDLNRLIVSEYCPMAYLGHANNSSDTNAALPTGNQLTLHFQSESSFQNLPVRATKAIQKGEEICIEHGWSTKAFQERCNAFAISHSIFNASPSLSPSLHLHAVGQQRQWENLCRFVAENADSYQSFPYAPFTVATSPDVSAHVFKGPSLLVPSLLGVRLKSPISPVLEKGLIIPYPGVLMPLSLFNRFSEEWHCPTGVEASNLAYGSPQIDVMLVGDPRSFGANINDPLGSQIDGVIKSRMEQSEFVLPSNSKVTIPDNFVCIKISANAVAKVADVTAADGFNMAEVGLRYEKASEKGCFWNFDTVEYCCLCFGKNNTTANPLCKCAFNECVRRCHASCFSLDPVRASDSVPFHCASHPTTKPF